MEPIMPFIIYFSAAVLTLFIKGRLRSAIAILFSILGFVNIFFITPQRSNVFIFAGFEVVLFHADRLNLVFGYIFSFITILIAVFTMNIKDKKHYVSLFVYVGSAMGILFSGDFLTFYLFWEIILVAAVVLISLNREEMALNVAFKYLLMHLAGGGVLLAGILLNYHYTNSMDLSVLGDGIPFMLILVGIGLNAAFLPVHTWLPDAYSKSPVSSALILTVFTTKTAVYALARIFPGTEALIIMGLSMALFGAIFALLRSDVRQILSYLIISSIGFMLIGIGIGGTEGINATSIYALNHILYNTLLFMCIGVVFHCEGKQDLSALEGLIIKMPFTALCLIVGLLAMAGLPLFNGFVSKTLVFNVLYSSPVAYYVLKFASVLITLTAIRIIYTILVKRSSTGIRYAPKYMMVPVIVIALTVLAVGAVPQITIAPLLNISAFPSIFTLDGVAETILLFLAAILLFLFLRTKFWMKNLYVRDLDFLYELILKEAMLFVKDPIDVILSWTDLVRSFIHRAQARLFTRFSKQHLLSSQGYTQAASHKRLRVYSSPLQLDYMTIGSSLLLTAFVVMGFLVFMFFRIL